MKAYRYLSLLSLFTVAITSCSNYKNPNEVKFEVSDLDVVEIHTDFQQQYLDSEDKDVFIYENRFKIATFSNSAPKMNKVTYTISSDNGVAPKKVMVNVSTSRDMANSMSFVGDEKETNIYNLKVGTTYYYQVSAEYLSTFTSEVKSFTVNDDSLRNIFVEGVENVRDLGGWDIGENKIYKQGLIYRTAQFNYGGYSNTYVSEPTELGKKVLLDDLKIKTEIDLRKTVDANGDDEVNSITFSPLGETVKYVSCPMVFANKNIFTQDVNKASLKLFFETLADVNNYPVAFHCLRGTDRTGALAYILGAIVGMSEEDLLTDYLFSNLANIGSEVRKSGIENFYIAGINSSSGDTYQEKAINYLLDNVDISLSTVTSIQNILIG